MCCVISILSGCQLVVYEAGVAFNVAYRNVIPETNTTIEEIKTTDGTTVVVRVESDFYSNRYVYSIESNDYPKWTYGSKFEVSSDGDELPITFDIVNKTPWIVLPVSSNQCEQFGFPREGLVFFKFDGKSWITTPYDQVPDNLQVNLLQNRENYKLGSGKVTPKTRQYIDSKDDNRVNLKKYINKDGSGKSIKEIVATNNYTILKNSCYYFNPPFDPDEKRSLREFVNKAPVVVSAKLVNISENEEALDPAQEQDMFVYPKTEGPCSQLIRRQSILQISRENQAEFSNVAGTPNGTFKSPGTAIRIELNGKTATHSFYLPQRGFRLAQISTMNCQADRIAIDFDSDPDKINVLEYDLNAVLLNKWIVQMPFLPKEGHMISNLSIDNEHIKITLVEFEQHSYDHGKVIPAKIHKRYFYEANLPTNR